MLARAVAAGGRSRDALRYATDAALAPRPHHVCAIARARGPRDAERFLLDAARRAGPVHVRAVARAGGSRHALRNVRHAALAAGPSRPAAVTARGSTRYTERAQRAARAARRTAGRARRAPRRARRSRARRGAARRTRSATAKGVGLRERTHFGASLADAIHTGCGQELVCASRAVAARRCTVFVGLAGFARTPRSIQIARRGRAEIVHLLFAGRHILLSLSAGILAVTARSNARRACEGESADARNGNEAHERASGGDGTKRGACGAGEHARPLSNAHASVSKARTAGIPRKKRRLGPKGRRRVSARSRSVTCRSRGARVRREAAPANPNAHDALSRMGALLDRDATFRNECAIQPPCSPSRACSAYSACSE